MGDGCGYICFLAVNINKFAAKGKNKFPDCSVSGRMTWNTLNKMLILRISNHGLEIWTMPKKSPFSRITVELAPIIELLYEEREQLLHGL